MSRVYLPEPARPSALLTLAQLAGFALFMGGFGGAIVLGLGLITGRI
jgi:hypothetical protein